MKPMDSGQYPGAQRRKVGEAVVTALADGYIDMNAALVPGADQDEINGYFRSPFLAPKTYRSSINAYLVETGGKRILIDSGGAQAGIGELGRLAPTLSAIGVEPGTVDALVMTHLHPDHAGGAFDGDGNAAFPNAEMIVRKAEHDHWHDDSLVNDDNRAFFDLARKAADAYAREGRLTLFDTDAEVIPGLHAEHLPGHTPGHTGFRIESDGDALLIWGDIVHMPPVQFRDPGFGIVFDVDGETAEKTRRRILDRAATDDLKIAGMHLEWPGFGSIERDGQGYRFRSAPHDYEPGHP